MPGFGTAYREMLPPGVDMEFDRLYKFLKQFLLAEHNDDGTHVNPPPAQISALGLPVGTTVPYIGSTVPTGWLLADGSAISRSTYKTLFDVAGTTYGAGDGETTFNLPDLRQRFPLGKAASGTGSTLGSTGGTIDHVHTGPSHTHPFTTGVPSATVEVAAGAGTVVATSTHTHTGPTDAAGAGSTGTANPPFLTLNFLVLYA